MKKNKDLGQKVRHPLRTVYPRIIFLHEKHDKRDKTKQTRVSRLYQDMILYCTSSEYHDMLQKQKEQGQPIGFKIRNIGYWLLHHNQDFLYHYSGSMSKTREFSIFSSIRNTIDRYLESLEKWYIVKRLPEVDADTRNGTKTPLYRYERVGMIVAWILEYRNRSDYHGKQEAKNKIFGLIQRMFKDASLYSSYKEVFLAEFYRKLLEYDNNNKYQPGLCDSIIRQIISSFENDPYPKAIDYLNHVLQTMPLPLRTKQPIMRDLYLQTLYELDEDTRMKVMDHDKSLFESKMLTSHPPPPKDWFDNREQNKNNNDTIVLCGTCKNKDCSKYNHYATAICDYYSLISAASFSTDNSYSQMECPECQTQRSIHIYNTYDDLVDSRRY